MVHGHWDYFQKQLLEVGLTQNPEETMALQILATVDLF